MCNNRAATKFDVIFYFPKFTINIMKISNVLWPQISIHFSEREAREKESNNVIYALAITQLLAL